MSQIERVNCLDISKDSSITKPRNSSTYCFNQSPILEEGRFVLNVIARNPGLYLIAKSLKFLDLRLQVCF